MWIEIYEPEDHVYVDLEWWHPQRRAKLVRRFGDARMAALVDL